MRYSADALDYSSLIKDAGTIAVSAGSKPMKLAVLTFALMSFTQIFFHSETWDQSVSILKQVAGLTPSGSQTLMSLGPGVAGSVMLCAAVAVFDGSGAPGVRWACAQLDKAAPRWLQYGACLFLVAVLSTDSGSRFVYGQF